MTRKGASCYQFLWLHDFRLSSCFFLFCLSSVFITKDCGKLWGFETTACAADSSGVLENAGHWCWTCRSLKLRVTAIGRSWNYSSLRSGFLEHGRRRHEEWLIPQVGVTGFALRHAALFAHHCNVVVHNVVARLSWHGQGHEALDLYCFVPLAKKRISMCCTLAKCRTLTYDIYTNLHMRVHLLVAVLRMVSWKMCRKCSLPQLSLLPCRSASAKRNLPCRSWAPFIQRLCARICRCWVGVCRLKGKFQL